ncbi:Nodule Cysteine-Rich (NCR) secreted peptide [Medicago truncatula]|uniref:Nodule Cysteine-Rich (NCR) secreted peptide n=2 Tax=Medicago truncatula TaxID=3880 RepID=A0A072TT06_MEDTR|nr:Nodule Cysteine-Rich (NCR) secreted peptide [Medicago truncatula]
MFVYAFFIFLSIAHRPPANTIPCFGTKDKCPFNLYYKVECIDGFCYYPV